MSAAQAILTAVEKAQEILALYVQPGPRNAERTINELMSVIDDEEVVKAVWE